MSATNATCVEHLWERHLEVHNKLERVVRICLHCGCKEICWARPSFRRHNDPARSEMAVAGICAKEEDR